MTASIEAVWHLEASLTPGATAEGQPFGTADARTTLRSVATVLDKQLKRQVSVDGVDYTVAVDPEGFG